MKKTAFTMSEILVVLVILGVVAAMSLPNLMSDTSSIQNFAKAKKLYYAVNTAFTKANLKYGNFFTWTSTDKSSDNTAQRVCGFIETRKIEGSVCTLRDGSTVTFDFTSGYSVIIDVDGTKAPNKEGEDKFTAKIDATFFESKITPPDGLTDEYQTKDDADKEAEEEASSGSGLSDDGGTPSRSGSADGGPATGGGGRVERPRR